MGQDLEFMVYDRTKGKILFLQFDTLQLEKEMKINEQINTHILEGRV